MLNENLSATGKLKLELFSDAGVLKSSETVSNLVVTNGLSFIASRVISASSTVMTHMAVGSGSTTPVLSNAALSAEIVRVSLTSSTVLANTITYKATFGVGVGTGAISEAGLFNAASSGTMLCRTAFSTVNKSSTDTLVITWTVTIN